MEKNEKYLLWVLHIAFIAVYLGGLTVDIMDVDAAQYASIAMEMCQTDVWLQVLHRGADYLDKPPLLFWASAFSYKIFGLGNVAYKLPSFLAAMLGVYSIYRFALLFYTRKTARHAALMLFSAQALVLICNDVRTDTLLLSFGTCAVWQLAAFLEKKDRIAWKNLFWGFVCIGFAMLAKGPIGLVMPAFAIGTQLLLTRNWRKFFRGEWILGLGLVALVLAPMSWGLYQQFDLHLDKTVNGKTGVSGLYFFFWEQSFGRVTGENVWKNDTTPFYFVHTYIWAFLPWSLLLLGALWQRFSDIVKEKFQLSTKDEAYSLGAFVLTFIALSMSKYKLPHYIFITLPWASVLTARFVESLFSNQTNQRRIWIGLQYFTFASMFLVAGMLVFYVFPEHNGLWLLGFCAAVAALLFYFFRKRGMQTSTQLVLQSLAVAAVTNIILNFFFYSRLLPWQGTTTMMKYARTEAKLDMEKVYLFHKHAHSLDVYGQRIFSTLDKDELKAKMKSDTPFYLSTNKEGLSQLNSMALEYDVLKAFPQFQVALLNKTFLNPNTREAALDSMYLVVPQRF